MSELALKLIAECKKTKNPKLDLGNCGLTEFPMEILELTHLEELNLKTKFYDSEKNSLVDCTNQGQPNVLRVMPDLGVLDNLHSLQIGGWWSKNDSKFHNTWSLDSLDFVKNNVKLKVLFCQAIGVSDIISINGIESLQKFYFSGNMVSDLSPLNSLTTLKELSLNGNMVTDLSPLIGLSTLQQLSFSNNLVSNLKPLSELNTLQVLYFINCKVTDLSPLSNLTDLLELDFSGNKISDLRPLTGLTSLQGLNFGANKVSDVRPLSSLKALQRLGFSENQVSDVSPLSSLTGLLKFDFSFNLVSDLSPLSSLTALQNLGFMNNQVSDLSPLSRLTALQELHFENNKASNLSPLSSLTALQELSLGNNEVSDLSPLSNLTALQVLDFVKNKVSDLSPLSSLKALQRLYFNRNEVSIVSPMSSLTSLQMLVFPDNKVSDLSPLNSLTALQLLDFTENEVSDLGPIKNLIFNGELKTIYAGSNPMRTPSIEIAKQGFEAIRNYFLQAQKWGEVNCSDIKVIFLGNSTSGKTTLSKMLVREVFEEVPSTHGILNDEWNFDGTHDRNVIKATLWDFGGQEYFHATHRLFLSPNSIYVLVSSKESELDGEQTTTLKIDRMDTSGLIHQEEIEVVLQQHTFPYWLNTIQYYLQGFTNKQEVLLVETKTQKPGVNFVKDEQVYPGLSFPADPFRLDAQQAFAQKEKMGNAYIQFLIWKNTLKDLICDKLKGYTIISVFPVIRDALAQVASTMTSEQSPDELNALCSALGIEPPDDWPVMAPWITFEEYETFVRKYFFRGDPDEDIINLTAYLQHSCGRVLHFDHIGLKGKICIDPIWLHQHVYRVLSPEIKEADGLFDFEYVDRMVPGDAITAKEMVEIMKSYRLIFELPDKSDMGHRQFIAPQYLPRELSRKKANELEHYINPSNYEKAVSIIFKEFMPQGVISQFIASRGYNAKSDLFWKDGICYDVTIDGMNYNLTVMISPQQRLVIDLFVPKVLNSFLRNEVIKGFVESVVQQNQENPNIQIQLPEKAPISYTELKRHCDTKNRDTRSYTDKNFMDYEFLIMDDDAVNIFISYSHDDIEALRVFEPQLRRWLKFDGININVFTDEGIGQFADWNDEIQSNVKKCDIFIFALSQAALTSDYILKNEFSHAHRKWLNNEAEIVVLEFAAYNNLTNPELHAKQFLSVTNFDLKMGGSIREKMFFRDFYLKADPLNHYMHQIKNKLSDRILKTHKRKTGQP